MSQNTRASNLIARYRRMIAECASGSPDCGVCIDARDEITKIEQERGEIPAEHQALSSGALKL